MVSITFKGINLEGNSSHGMWYPINCERCGPSASSIPVSGVDTLSLQDLRVTCVKCSQPVYVARADYDFQRVAFNLLFDAGITRQQARLFARLVEKSSDLDWLVERSAQINPKLEQVAKIARKEKEPRSAFKLLSRVALFVAGLATFTLAADDLWDRWQDGELFQHGASQNAEDVEQNSKGDANNASPQESPDKAQQEFDGGIDV